MLKTTIPAEAHRPSGATHGAARKTIVAAIKAVGACGITYADLRTRYGDAFSDTQIKNVIKRACASGELINLRQHSNIALWAHRSHATAVAMAAASPPPAEGFAYVPDGPTIGRRPDDNLDHGDYLGAELRPQQNRPAGNDFMACPSRIGNRLVWRDGRTARITEETAP